MFLAGVPASSDVPIEAVWAGVAVVVISALITTIGAYLRTKQVARDERERLGIQLDAEQKRLDAQLEAESSRQREQLAHDRELSDLQELRTRLDEVIDMGEAALSAACEARERFNAGDQAEGEAQLAQAKQCLGQSGYKERRLRLRIGVSHPVVEALVAYRMKIQGLANLVHGSASQSKSVPFSDWNTAMAQVATAQVEVIQMGREHLGAQLP